MNKIEEIEDVEIEDNEDNEETLQAEFTLISKEVKGHAYLIGNDKKATNQFINAFIAGMKLSPEKAIDVKQKMEEKLVQEFSFMAKVKEPKTDADAIIMLGESTSMKMIRTKVETNQMDKLRNERSKSIVDGANMAQVMGELLK